MNRRRENLLRRQERTAMKVKVEFYSANTEEYALRTRTVLSVLFRLGKVKQSRLRNTMKEHYVEFELQTSCSKEEVRNELEPLADRVCVFS